MFTIFELSAVAMEGFSTSRISLSVLEHVTDCVKVFNLNYRFMLAELKPIKNGSLTHQTL